MCSCSRQLNFVLLFLILLPSSSVATEAADEFSDFSELSLESLLNQTVVSAAKHEQAISESPVAVTLITADEIAASGAANIPDILRDIAGLDVINTSAGDINVSARGLNKSGANSTLVMIDGRSVYEEFYGTTLWKSLPVAMTAIKAIEVIKGPGSAFYGANAFAAVINIITYDPAEMQGTYVSARAGSQGQSLGSVVHAGQSGDNSWSMSGDVERALNWEGDRTDLDMLRLNGRLDRQLSANSKASISGGYTSGLQSFQPGGTQMNLDGETSFLRADYRTGNFQARWFQNSWALHLVPFGEGYLSGLSYMDSHSQDLEIQHALNLLPGHFLQLGGGYRHKRFRWNREAGPLNQDLYSAFLYDEWRFTESLLLSLGMRWDHHPLVNGHLAPRGGIVWKPNSRHAFRASYGVAHRNPSYLENYLNYEFPGPFGTVSALRGDEQLRAERIDSVEVGYQGMITDDVLGSVAIFHNQVDDLIAMAVESEVPVPPAPIPGIPLDLAFGNNENWTISGGELAAEMIIASWLQSKVHYGYLWAEDTGTSGRVECVPNHVAGATFTVFPASRHSFYLVVRYKSEIVCTDLQAPLGTPGVVAESHLTFDLRWHYRSDKKQAVVGIGNLFNNAYRDTPDSIEQERRAFVSVGLEF